MHFRWIKDDTGAASDAATFAELTTLLGIDSHEITVLDDDDSGAHHNLLVKVGSILRESRKKPGTSVLLLHYAGHGMEQHNGTLALPSSSGEDIDMDDVMQNICSKRIIPLTADVNVVFILDCCYSYLSTRSPNGNLRRVEVLCAGDRNDPVANGSIGAHSFTQKVFVEIRK